MTCAEEIAAACGLSPTGIYPALVRKLKETFEHTSGADGLRSVIVLDEAHDLRPESLAMLRLLTNFDISRGNLRAIDRLALKSIELAARAGSSAVSTAEVIAARNQLWV